MILKGKKKVHSREFEGSIWILKATLFLILARIPFHGAGTFMWRAKLGGRLVPRLCGVLMRLLGYGISSSSSPRPCRTGRGGRSFQGLYPESRMGWSVQESVEPSSALSRVSIDVNVSWLLSCRRHRLFEAGFAFLPFCFLLGQLLFFYPLTCIPWA